MFNKNELILDKVRSLVTHDLATGQLLFRLTSLEEPSLQCTAEGEEITDAIGAVITTLYRAKKATFSATNSLISLDLAASQYGAKKEVASAESKIIDHTYEILTVTNVTETVEGEEGGEATTVTKGVINLSNVPVNDIKFIYSLVNGEIGTAYKAGAAVSETEFVVDAEAKTITVPTGLTGKVYVEYQYETENAVRIVNRASQFPEACSLTIYAYFKDRCNENLVYSGKIICPKAKLNPEQVELALTSTGKHAFEFTMMKDYCADEGEDELFTIIVAQ